MKKKPPFPPATYIDREGDLRRLVDQLLQEPAVAIDTESNSLYAYREQVCLFQFSTRSADYIVDPLILQDMSLLAPLMESPAVEKIFHAAEYDLVCIKRDFGFDVRNIFDTMLAARICGYKAVGLGSLLSLHLGVEIDKSHQRDDWSRRPLPAGSLHYAQMDTHYLPALRDILYQELQTRDHLDEAHEVFDEVCHMPPGQIRQFDPDGYWNIGFPLGLTMRQMAILRELYLLREQFAEARDCPPFKIFSNKTLVELAQVEPNNLHHLASMDGLTASFVRRHGRDILTAIQRGRHTRISDPPRHQRPDPVVSERYTALHAWRKERAEQRGVESDIIISKNTLWTLAYRSPTTLEELRQIKGLGPWRLATYGHELLSVIQQHNNGSE